MSNNFIVGRSIYAKNIILLLGCMVNTGVQSSLQLSNVIRALSHAPPTQWGHNYRIAPLRYGIVRRNVSSKSEYVCVQCIMCIRALLSGCVHTHSLKCSHGHVQLSDPATSQGPFVENCYAFFDTFITEMLNKRFWILRLVLLSEKFQIDRNTFKVKYIQSFKFKNLQQTF